MESITRLEQKQEREMNGQASYENEEQNFGEENTIMNEALNGGIGEIEEVKEGLGGNRQPI